MIDLEALKVNSEFSISVIPSLTVSRLTNGLFALSLVNSEGEIQKPSFHFSIPPSGDPGSELEKMRGEIVKLEENTPDGEINKDLENLIQDFNRVNLESDDWFNKCIDDMERLGDAYDLRVASIMIGEASRLGYEINNDVPFIYWFYNHIGCLVDKVLEDEK